MTVGDPGEHGRLTDAELVQRIVAVDAAALAAFYDRHAAAGISLARMMLAEDAAEDVVQTAFMDVWRNAAAFDRARMTGRSWLLGLVRRRCLAVLRELDDRERHRIARELLGRVKRAPIASAAALTDDQRHALELAYFGGWSPADIADQLGVPAETVKHRLRLALEALTSSLDTRTSDD